MIGGACLSACTLVLGIVPRSKICVTRRATLGFHAAWMPGPNGKPVPEFGRHTGAVGLRIRSTCASGSTHGAGFRRKMMFLRGRELMSMYPECRDDDWMQ